MTIETVKHQKDPPIIICVMKYVDQYLVHHEKRFHSQAEAFSQKSCKNCQNMLRKFYSQFPNSGDFDDSFCNEGKVIYPKYYKQ